MGMSIDESMKVLQEVPKVMPITKESINVALDTMRKYQKIAELYDYWRSGNCEYTISCMENIGKVLRDGNDD